MTRIAFINQDRGVGPRRAKGAAVHLRAMRDAFSQLGCSVLPFDEHRQEHLLRSLEAYRGNGFDMVYERYALGRDTGASYAAEHGIPHVIEVNAPLAEEAAQYRNVSETAEDRDRDERLFSQADCVLAVSTQVAEYAIARGARPESVLVRPNAIDTGRFNTMVSGKPFRERHGLIDAFILGFHGRERPWHGFDHLVEVVSNLLERETETTLVVAGEGDFKALNRLPSNRYRRLGWQDHEDIPGIVAAFDVLPLTYPKDAPTYFSPLKLTEAMACAVVPVVPKQGDLCDLVEHGTSGLTYQPGDMAAVTEHVAWLAKHPEKREALGDGAAAVARNHSWKAIATTILNLVLGHIPKQAHNS